MSPTPRPGILRIKPYIGGAAAAAGIAEPIRLASNENPLGASPRAAESYAGHAGELHRYPDGASAELRAALAETHGLAAERIVCGAGSDELISLLIRAYAGPGDEVLYSAHGFLMYPLASLAAGATPLAVPEVGLKADIDAILARANLRTKVVCLANPNNPTGSYLTGEELRRLADGLPSHVLLLIDSAYAEYVLSNDYEAGDKLVEASMRVVMLRTFSKIHGLAALRLGWAYCPPEVAGVLNRVRGPFNLNAAAQAAGLAALRDGAHVESSRAHNARWLAWFRDEARALGLEAPPSAGNFVLLGFGKAAGKSAAEALSWLEGRGILVRGMEAYGLPAHLRVTIGTESDMRSLVEALRAFLS